MHPVGRVLRFGLWYLAIEVGSRHPYWNGVGLALALELVWIYDEVARPFMQANVY